jgi:hypothetical protein
MREVSMRKLKFAGVLLSVQPRIRLTRSFDQRSHEYLGYTLLVDGTIDGQPRTFTVGVGPGAHVKFQFCVGGSISGEGVRLEVGDENALDVYRVSKVRYVALDRAALEPPPWEVIPPPLPVYRQRGHRRLAAQRLELSCRSCIWGAKMPVTLILDQWRPENRRLRVETFCYGPKSCRLYGPGPTRKVPGRKGMTWEEEDWVDEDATAHRGTDE